MPELAEVEYYRKQWDPALGEKILEVLTHPKNRIFRGTDTKKLGKNLPGKILQKSEARGKQMLFQFKPEAWLGIHLGMTGKLRIEEATYHPQKHDHLVLRTKGKSCVFSDYRGFGRVLFHEGKVLPEWWTNRAPEILSREFTISALREFLKRRRLSPIKPVLLMQERFPGVGNWMADEILWRAAIHPRQPAASLTPKQTHTLWKEVRKVCRQSLQIIGKDKSHPPDSWLFGHRWRKGGICPKTHKPLEYAVIGGRNTCWSPARQKLASMKKAFLK